MNSTTQIDALVHSEKVRPKPAKKKKVDTPLSYRLMVLYRFALVLLGGYLLAALSALTIAKVFIANPVNAAMSATLIAFCLNCAAFIWVFMVQKTLKATLGIAVPCIALYALLKFLG